jgi:putative ABC transport system permease protein
VLGILIGVGSVVGVVSIGEGLRRTVVGELDRLGGGRLIMVMSPRPYVRQGDRWVPRPWDDYLTARDVVRIRNESQYVRSVLPMVSSGSSVARGKVETSAQLQGTDATYADIMGWEVATGRFLQPSDLAERARVCVLGDTIAEDLFGKRKTPLGELVRIGGERYRVVGRMVEKRMFGDDWGRNIVIPSTTLQARITGRKRLDMLFVHARSLEETPFAVAEVKSILRRYHKYGKEFEVRDIGEELQQVEVVFLILKAVVGGIAGISLLVGGIGVMNIMLVSVTERTREIGIRKAIGAQPGHILTQFLVESVALSVFGGLLGLLFGLSLGKGCAFLISKISGGEFLSVVSVNAVVLAVTFSAAVGIFFGVYPALRAARLNPVEALRYE